MISQRLNRYILFHESSFKHTSYFIYLQLNVTSMSLCTSQDNNVHQRHTQKSAVFFRQYIYQYFDISSISKATHAFSSSGKKFQRQMDYCPTLELGIFKKKNQMQRTMKNT